ncbi:MAG: GumC family protein [Sulfuricella sp.]
MTDPLSSNTEQRATNNEPQPEDEISLLDLLIVLAKHKKLILGLPLAVAIVAVIYSLLLPPIYTASTTILPPQQNQSSAAAMLSQLGGAMGGLAGGIAGIKSPNDLYVGMLKSRTLADTLIQRFDLKTVYQAQLPSGVRAALEGASKITSGKDGMITIEVDDKDPKLAAALANGYVEGLVKLTSSMAVTEAGQRRLFFEQQMHLAKDNLARAESAAKSALDKGGISMVDEQGKSMLGTTAQLRAQISVKEVQIGAMKSFAAERNPDLQKAQQELAVMRQQLAKLEGSGETLGNPGKGENGQGFANLALLRDVKYHEVVFELLAKQYEMAKLDEAKDPTLIQVLDKAIVPDRKSKPKRAQIVILATLAAGFLAVLWAFLEEAMEKARQNPESSERMKQFRRFLAWR